MRAALLLLSACLILPYGALAGVLTVNSLDVKAGAITVEQGNGYEPGRGGGRLEQAVQADYGLTSFWKSGAEFTAVKPGSGAYRYALTEWKNTISILRQADGMPVAIGLRAQYGLAADRGDADRFDARLLLRRQQGDLDMLANIGGRRELGAHRAPGVSGDLRGSLRYWGLADGRLAPAVDYQGKTGPLHKLQGWHAQDHRAGPVVYAKFDNGVGFDAGYLAGLSEAAPSHSVKLNVRYGF